MCCSNYNLRQTFPHKVGRNGGRDKSEHAVKAQHRFKQKTNRRKTQHPTTRIKRTGSFVLSEHESKYHCGNRCHKPAKLNTISHGAASEQEEKGKKNLGCWGSMDSTLPVHRNPHSHVINLKDVQSVGLVTEAITERRLLTVDDRAEYTAPCSLHLKYF